MKIVIISLLLPVAILSFLPERAWAPPTMIEVIGEVSLITLDDNVVTGEPWMHDRRMQNTGLNSPYNPDPDPGQNPHGGPWW